MTEDVRALEAERGSEFGEFLNETLDRPERLVMRAIGFSRAELVVEYDRPFLAEYAQRFQIVVCETGAAMERD